MKMPETRPCGIAAPTAPHSPTPKHFLHILLILMIVGPAVIGSAGACLGSEPDTTIRAAIVDTLSAKLRELYVYPDIAERMARLIRTRLHDGDYDEIDGLEGFVTELNRDMLSVFPDGHLDVTVLREPASDRDAEHDWWETHAENSRFDNFGFRRIERLAGNIGYLELTGFDYPELAGNTLVSAMQYLAHTDAMIIDLRQNPGGRGETVQVLLSYFFEDHRVHYLTEQDGVRNFTRQWWTLPYLTGSRRPSTPLYILVGAGTGSAAEEFAFAMKNLGRATIVGQTTAGAANKTHSHAYPDLCIEIHMPDGRSFDPITGKDWEGVGVAPDIVVETEQALDVAHALAIDTLLDGETRADRRFKLDWVRRAMKAAESPPIIDEATLQRFVGTYGPRLISREGDTLYYQRENRPRFALIPLGDDWFRLEGLDYFRIRFGFDDQGVVTGLLGVYDDGSESPSERTGDR